MYKVSIIIPIYNALSDVKLLLESICDNLNFEISEVILVNDFSDEETSVFLRDFVNKNEKIKLLENDENLGFVKTCNKGMQNSNGDIIVLLNSDTIIPKGFDEKIIKCFEHDNKIGIASPVRTFGGQYAIKMPTDWSLEKMNHQLQEKHKCTYPIIPSAEGCCFCIRKDVIENQGYLDEIYGKGYHEETDYAYRAITNGWKNVLIDDLYIYHKMHASFGKDTRKKLIEQNNVVFNERWSGFRETFIKNNKWKNPVIKIEYEMFPHKRFFDFGLSKDRKHYAINILGIKFKIRNKNYIDE